MNSAEIPISKEKRNKVMNIVCSFNDEPNLQRISPDNNLRKAGLVKKGLSIIGISEEEKEELLGLCNANRF